MFVSSLDRQPRGPLLMTSRAPATFSHTTSQSLSRDEYEEDAERGVDGGRHPEDHEGALDEELPDEGLTDAGEIEGRVLAVAEEGEGWVYGVLVRGEAVDAYREGQDDLSVG